MTWLSESDARGTADYAQVSQPLQDSWLSKSVTRVSQTGR